jgi:hypothetical protein
MLACGLAVKARNPMSERKKDTGPQRLNVFIFIRDI